MRSIPTVTGFILTDRGEAPPPAAKGGFSFVGNDPLRHVVGFDRAVNNLPMIEAVAAGNGFLNQYPDWDNVVRRVPLILKFGGKAYPSLAAEALRVAAGAKGYVARAAGANTEKSLGESTGLTAIRIGPLIVPTDAAGRVWLHYAARQPDRTISAADVLDGKINPDRFADHIVLVGTSAAGVINDQRATPIGPDIRASRSRRNCSIKSCKGRSCRGPIGRLAPRSCSPSSSALC